MKRLFTVLLTVLSVGLIAGCAAKTHHKKQAVTQPVKQVINWRKSSENSPYPKITSQNGSYLYVSIKKQRVYVMSQNHHVLYTMYASTGENNSTPRGTFRIQAERGKFFYNKTSKEGARYWTSFKNHGEYLFHTVPTNSKGQYMISEANLLGQKANSHGCVRLAIPDAHWINKHVPWGTKVVIK